MARRPKTVIVTSVEWVKLNSATDIEPPERGLRLVSVERDTPESVRHYRGTAERIPVVCYWERKR